MSLQVIGAGFGRTGTSSLKLALEILGFGPCHHMFEVNASAEQKQVWRSIASGHPANWDEVFCNYNSAVDWPAAFYWQELAAHYPDAKIILTVRDADSWYQSMSKTIFPSIEKSSDAQSLGTQLIKEQVFGGRMDREHAIACYQQNIEKVTSSVPKNRLLVWDVSMGWQPLCDFLACPVPDQPFPFSNSSAAFQAASQ